MLETVNQISILFPKQVKRRLDYQVELNNVMRRVEQRHMVDWIIGNVKKSITAKQVRFLILHTLV